MRIALTACVALGLLSITAQAEPRHGLSAFGDLKYPPDFKHFDYVNPDAPKGGRLASRGILARDTFDSFNGFILKGTWPENIGLLFDTLMARATDEPDAMYGLVAKTADLAPDKKSVTFQLREEARFSDGSKLTGDDVCDSFRLIKDYGDERIRIAIRDIEKCDVLAPYEVRYSFKGDNTRDLPLSVAALPILSKAYYATHDFTKTSLDPPLGSGPYKIGSFKTGQYVSYVRRPDYWGADLPVNKGRYNFDEVRNEYFKDRTAVVEALKAGVLDLHEEFTSRDWATAYNTKSVEEGRLIKEVLPDNTPSGAQGLYFNMRREKFQDVRVRKAFDLAFDFEWMNTNLFYGSYKRTTSFFENSALMAKGKPSPEELQILEPFRKELRPEVFEDAYLPPISDGSGQDRKLLRQASQLLAEAGWKREGTLLVNAKGEKFTVEFLIDGPTSERILAPYAKNLRLLGIDTTLRGIDPAQQEQRMKDFDFDVDIVRLVGGQTPGDELKAQFSSDAAKTIGSYNLSGIALPAVDGLIDKMVAAKSREELMYAGRALDRVLRAEHVWVPNWGKASHWIVHWDIFEKPQIKPEYDRGITDTWWVNAEKAKTLRRGN
ncbi:extracellular solute-binding protein [Taklimakanibacter albus]|uniref:ABC transporter substrate-binding protein n=1 Tax=Taklimakanibacter albus TaxID=2800327 RepID=A0ACC5RDX3_9HYPH|nr:extracellular solute-binding protein [Aestuariivirga sp. YIM B02566]MBK1870899.1 ABC transporter substrate-binding protein [Aestuariivirga sp. YIM B02566]